MISKTPHSDVDLKNENTAGNIKFKEQGTRSSEDLRYSGIRWIGNIPGGSHSGLFYNTQKTHTEIVKSYFKAGLLGNELCILLTLNRYEKDAFLAIMKESVNGFSSYLIRKQIEVIPFNELINKGCSPQSLNLPETIINYYRESRKRKFNGLRISYDYGLFQNTGSWEEFEKNEAEVTRLIRNSNILVFTSFHTKKCGAYESMRAGTLYPILLIKQNKNWKVVKPEVNDVSGKSFAYNEFIHNAAFNNNPDAIIGCEILTDKKGYSFDFKILEANKSFENIIGLEKLNITGKKATEVIPFIDKFIVEKYCRAAETGTGFELFELKTKRWFYVQITGIQKNRFVAQHTDITLRKTAEEKLETSEDYLYQQAELMEYAPLMMLNLKGEVIVWNTGMIKLYGYTAKEVLGKNSDDFLQPKYPMPLPDILDILHKEGRWEGDINCLGNNGKSLWISSLWILHKNILDQPTAIIRIDKDITQRKQLEYELNEIADKYSTIVNTASDGILLCDSNGRIIEVNEACCRMSGYTHDELLLTTAKKVEIHETAEEIAVHLKRIKNNGCDHFESQHRRKDGSVFDVDVTIVYVNRKGGQFAVFIRDITERKQVEKKLRQSDKQLRLAQISANVGIWEWMPQTNELNITPEFDLLYGLPPGTIKTYDDWREKVHPDDIKKVEEQINQAVVNQRPFDLEFRIFHSSGEIRWINTKGSAVYNKTSSTIHVNGVDIDITDRKKTEDKLHKSEENYRELVESANSIILKVNTDGRVTFINDYAQKFFGYSAEELLGRTAIDTIVPRTESTGRDLREMVDKIYSDPDSFLTNINENIKKNGERVWIEWKNKALFDKEGNRIGHMAIGRDITEKFKIEEKLRENEKNFRAILDVTQESIYMYDTDGRIIAANYTAADRLGCPVNEITGHHFSELIPPDLANHRMNKFAEVIRSGKSLEFEDEREGTIFEHHFFPILKNNKVIRVVSFGRDITDRRKKEFQLHKLNKTLKALSKSSQAMMRATNEKDYLNEVCRIVVEDCGYVMVWVGFAENDEYKSVKPAAHAGFDNEYIEKLKVTWSDSVYGQGPTGTAIRTGKPAMCRNIFTDPKYEPWREKAIKRGYASSIVFPFIEEGKAFGSITIFSKELDPFSEDEVNLLNDLANDLSYGIISLRLREAQKKALEMLRESEKKYRLFFEFVPLGVTITDKQGNILESNKESERLLNIRKAVHKATKIDDKEWQIIRKDYTPMPPEEFASFRALKENRLIENVEMGIVREDNTISWINVTAAPFPFKDYGIIIVYSDISWRVEAEEKLNKYMQDLKGLNATKDKFFGIIAHDLRNPFFGLLGSAEIIAHKAEMYDIEAIKSLGQIMYHSAKNAHAMLENLLEWARSQSGDLKFNPRALVISELISENMMSLRASAANKNIELCSTIPFDLKVYADTDMLNTVVRNLLSNAIKFTDKGGKVTVHAKPENNDVLVVVKDNGTGIPAENMEKLFRLDIVYRTSGTEEEKGTGLGLILCKEFIEKHGGKIWVESIEGEGSEFKFTLPSKAKLNY